MAVIRHLLSNLAEVDEHIRGRYLLLLLDYDGTLTEIVARPELATISAARKRILSKLAACRKCRVAIISGRGLADIRRMVSVPGLTYSGSHGFELGGPGISYRYRIPKRSAMAMQRMLKLLRGSLSGIDGIIVERKEFSFCVHYRQCRPRDAAKVKKLVSEAVSDYVARGLVRMTSGKKVVEIMPPADWDKGAIVRWLLKEHRKAHPDHKLLPVFLGDDLTDETAFKALGQRGLTCFVGRPRRSAAQYYVRDVPEAYAFLKYVLNRCGQHTR